MDPLSQGLLGAAVAQVALGRRLRCAAAVGAVAGMSPDLDVLIRSSSDPLLSVVYHRHFTHALSFIPVGGSLAALPWLLSPRLRAERKAVWLASVLGYATHGVLDAFTSYGTLLLWPFSSDRLAWDMVAAVDPLFTLALLIGVVGSVLARARGPAAVGLLVAGAYLSSGLLQRNEALDLQRELAAQRGHERSRGRVIPTLGNQLVWHSIYLAGDTVYADRIRVPWRGPAGWTPGGRAEHVDLDDLPPALRENARVVEDFTRFRWFTQGWTARSPAEPDVIADARYSRDAGAFAPYWGIRFDPSRPVVPTQWVTHLDERDLSLAHFWAQIARSEAEYRSPPGRR